MTSDVGMDEDNQDVERILSSLGIGKWQIVHFVATAYASGMVAPNTLAGPFVAPRQEFRCRLPQDTQNVAYFENDTDRNACSYFAQSDNGTVTEEPCTDWVFDDSVFKSTLTSEFGLVCQKDYLRATYQSVYMLGVMIGSLVNGVLADRYGRKLVFSASTFSYTAIAIVSCWLPNLSSLLVARFMLGTLHTSLLKTGYILALEIVRPKMRSIVGITIFFPWGLGTIAWGGLAYLQRSWRYLLTFSSLPCLLLLPAVWFLDESPRWLVVKGKPERAEKVLKKAARWNGTSISAEEIALCINRGSLAASVEKSKIKQRGGPSVWIDIFKKQVGNLMILFRTPRLLLASVVTHLDYFVLGMVFFGISLNGGNLPFDIFSYMALMGLVEAPAYTVMVPIVSKWGRRIPIALLYILSGVFLLFQPFLPLDPVWPVITTVLIGKATISMAFQGNNLYITELFPTEVRTRGVSSSFMLSRIGSAVAPFINDYLGVIHSWAPSVVFGIASITAGVAALMLWETVDLALPETIVELESEAFKPSRKLPTLGIT